MDTNANKNKRKRRQVLWIGTDDFVIDEEDYRVLVDIISHFGSPRDAMRLVEPQQMIDIAENGNEERRVCKLKLQRCSKVTSLPPSIVHLTDLKELDLYWTKMLFDLPEEIGDLTSLTTLNLSHSSIASLPPSIGRLKNLGYLDLSFTKNLLKLPQEIGDLAGLNNLDLRCSGIASLPPSIGRLKNLNKLYLCNAEKFIQLPEEIGDLTNLTNLDMHESTIQKLPEAIGNLTNLTVLNLENASITSLPDSIGRLKGLMELNLYRTHIPELLLGNDPNNDYLLMLVRSCQSLGSIGYDIPQNTKVRYALACNRARFRTKFGNVNDKVSECESSAQLMRKLWPLLLHRATRAFDRYSNKLQYDRPNYERTYTIQKPDAIYRFLIDGRESFVGLLVDRNTK